MSGYNVGVQITLVDHLTAGLHKVTAAMHAAHTASGSIHAQMKQVANQMALVNSIGNIGHSMFHGGMEALGGMLEAGKQYQFELTKMQLKGFSLIEQQQALAAAHKNTSEVLTTNTVGNIRTIMDLRQAFESLPHSMEMLPIFTKQQAIMRASGDYHTRHAAEEMTFSGAKYLELIGAMNKVEDAVKQLDMMRKSVTQSGGKLSFDDFLATAKFAGASRYLYDDEYKYKMQPLFMMENKSKGGSSATWGTQEAAMSKTFLQGGMTMEPEKRLIEMGLVNPLGQKLTKENHKQIVAKGLVDKQMFAANPFNWTEKYMIPALDKANPAIAKEKDAGKRDNMRVMDLQQLGFDRNTTKAMSSMIKQVAQVHREVRMYAKLPSMDEAFKQTKNSMDFQANAAHEQFNTLMQALGKEAIPLATQGLRALNTVLGQVNAYITRHPEVAKLVVDFAAGVAVVGAGLAVVAPIVAAVFLGVPVATITAWGAGIAAAVVGATAFFASIRKGGGSFEAVETICNSFSKHFPDAISMGLNAAINAASGWAKNLAQTLIHGPEVSTPRAAMTGGVSQGGALDMMRKSMGKGLSQTTTASTNPVSALHFGRPKINTETATKPINSTPPKVSMAPVLNQTINFHGPITEQHKNEGIRLSQGMARTLRNTLTGDGTTNSRWVTG